VAHFIWPWTKTDRSGVPNLGYMHLRNIGIGMGAGARPPWIL